MAERDDTGRDLRLAGVAAGGVAAGIALAAVRIAGRRRGAAERANSFTTADLNIAYDDDGPADAPVVLLLMAGRTMRRRGTASTRRCARPGSG